jgi:hypothetical protein
MLLKGSCTLKYLFSGGIFGFESTEEKQPSTSGPTSMRWMGLGQRMTSPANAGLAVEALKRQ